MVDFCTQTTTDIIRESIHWLDQLCQDVQGRRWERDRDQRDEFQSNDNYVALATPDSSQKDVGVFDCNLGRMIVIHT